MADIRLRKSRLKDDLELLEGSFENRVSSVKKNIFGSVRPLNIIRKKPLQVVGIAVIAGIAVGLSSGKKESGSKKGERSNNSSSHYRSPGFATILFDEVKRIAARRAAGYISDFVDQKRSERQN